MKKILFTLLLFTAFLQAQTYPVNPTKFGKISLNTNGVSTSTSKINTQEADGQINYIDAVNLPVPTTVTNALELKTENSAGAISGFGITNNGNGTVNIASGVALLRIANTSTATLIKFPIPAVTNLALTDNVNNYVLVDYNGGTPAITVTTSPGTINTTTNSLIYVISRVGNTLDYVPLVGQNVDSNAKLRRRFLNSEGLRRASGAVLTGSNRNLVVTAGLYYSGLIEVPTPAFDTSTSSTFTQVYESGSTWIRSTGNTQINNTQYNNAGVLTNMPTNDYRVDYVYILANNPSKLYVILGNTTYANITNARLAPVPANLPSELQAIGTRIGRVIIQRLATTMEVSSEFATVYNAGSATLHNDLGGLNAGDFQHLTAAEKSTVEYTTNKATDFTTVNNTLYPTVQATKTYADKLIINETTGLFSNIQTLINNNPVGTTINLKPNHVYNQDNPLILKEGNVVNGNGATLKRNAQQVTTTTVSCNENSTSITVSSIPAGWKSGDYLQLYTGDTFLDSSYKYEIIIQSISGNVITLTQPIGRPAQGLTRTWNVGTNCRKVFSQITSERSIDLFTNPTKWTVNDLILDGNKSNNSGSFYWGVNMTIQNNGRSILNNLTFKDIPNENIFGTGFSVYNCSAKNLNGSFIHFSGDVLVGQSILGGEVSGNVTENTNIKSTSTVTGHSEGVITFSFTSGRTKIHSNRFLGGGESVLGALSYGIHPTDGSLKDFIFTDNYAEGFSKVVYNFIWNTIFLTKPDNVLIIDNIFSNCGVDDWSVYEDEVVNFGTVKFYENILTNGTVINKIPQVLDIPDVERVKIRGFEFTDANLLFNNTELGRVRFDHIIGGTNLPSNDYWSIETRRNENTSNFGVQTAIGWGLSNTNKAYVRSVYNNVWTSWEEILYKDSPSLEGAPTAPTAAVGTNTTQIATTAFVQSALGGGVLEFDIGNKTVWNKGNGASGSTSFGQLSAGSATGNDWASFGHASSNSKVSGNRWSAYGAYSGVNNTSGSNYTLVGAYSASKLSDDLTSATSFDNSTYIGYNTKVSSNGVTNENVFGYNATGSGSNTVTLGDTNITRTFLRGVVVHSTEYTVATLPTPTDKAFAVVTDALAPTYLTTVVGGGTVVCPVFYNGTNWVAH